MQSKFDEIKKMASNLKSKLMCQFGHRTIEQEEAVPGKPPGYIKVTTVCETCGLVFENPHYKWKV